MNDLTPTRQETATAIADWIWEHASELALAHDEALPSRATWWTARQRLLIAQMAGHSLPADSEVLGAGWSLVAARLAERVVRVDPTSPAKAERP